MEPNAVENIAVVIQLSVAPVFLLAGIAGMLNVLSIRLGRIVDRARIVEARLMAEPQSGHTSTLQEETTGLWKRIRLVNWSLRLFVCAALLVCLVIVTLFLAELARMNLSDAIAAQFICAMTLMIGGLLLFLFEVSVSTNRIRRGIVEILDTDK
ncbi:MAG: DUF2721 domain-containing protein [Pseudohongiellaceae bacterium]|nr:DUF2721 domain-containing protein [Gammaproteobacteria bacterium]